VKEEKKSRSLNVGERRALKTADISVFIRQYGRKAQRGVEPNDRRYDERLARRIRQVKPVDLDSLIRDDED
jgi:hypothetical protein